MARLSRNEIARLQLAAIVDSSEVAIICTSLDGTIETWNPGAERIYGYQADEAIGKPISLLLPADRPSELPAILGRLQRGERVPTFETPHLRKDGTRFDASISVSPIKDASGQMVGAASLIRDVSERKRLERELKRRLDELREVDRRKDEFLAMLAHELRNPLAPLRSALEILEMGVADSNMVDWAREMMNRQVDYLVRLVDGLLDVSRLMQGRIELQREPVELATVVARSIELAQPLIDSRGHKFNVRVPSEPIWLEADPMRLTQVIANVLNNAAKYTRSPGEISLVARRNGDQAVVRITDNGMGIAPDMLPRIFDLFVQGNPSAARTDGGLGIGLTLVRRIVELHGGVVTAASRGEGHGSEFEIRLPVMQRKEIPQSHKIPEPEAARPVLPIGRQRVLVVEDNVYAAKSFATLLRLDGHEVQIANDGLAALEMAQAFHPSVLLLDIGLPGIDGYEVARRLRAMPEFAHVQMIAMTGYGQAEDRRRSKEAGIDHHLVKPVKIDFVRSLLAGIDGTPSPHSSTSDSPRFEPPLAV